MANVVRVASRLSLCDELAVDPYASAVLDATGGPCALDPSYYRLCRVDLDRVPGGGTAFGKAVAWLGQMLAEGENVLVCGPQAPAIAKAHLRLAGFDETEADTLVGEVVEHTYLVE